MHHIAIFVVNGVAQTYSESTEYEDCYCECIAEEFEPKQITTYVPVRKHSYSRVINMKDLKEIYSPVYGCTIFDDKHEEDNRKVIDYETMSSISKSLKIKQLKLLHKHIIDTADELYRFSDELDMSDKEEFSCKISIIEAIKELNHITEFLTKHTLGDDHEYSK